MSSVRGMIFGLALGCGLIATIGTTMILVPAALVEVKEVWKNKNLPPAVISIPPEDPASIIPQGAIDSLVASMGAERLKAIKAIYWKYAQDRKVADRVDAAYWTLREMGLARNNSDQIVYQGVIFDTWSIGIWGPTNLGVHDKDGLVFSIDKRIYIPGEWEKVVDELAKKKAYEDSLAQVQQMRELASSVARMLLASQK